MKCRYRSRSVFQRISAADPLLISRTCFRVTLVPLVLGGAPFVVDGVNIPLKAGFSQDVALVFGGCWCGDEPVGCFFHHEVTGEAYLVWEYMDPEL